VTGLQMMGNLLQQTFELLGQLQIVEIVDIIIVSIAIYKLIMLTKETRANQVLKGLALVLVASQISQWLNLTALIWIFTETER
jgi:diadenylate cyclase